MNKPEISQPHGELFDQLILLSEEYLKSHLEKYKDQQMKRISDFNGIIEKSINQLKNSGGNPSDLWEPLTESLSELNVWVEFKDYPEFKERMIEDLSLKFNSFISTLPLFQTDVWEESFFTYKNRTFSPGIFIFRRIKTAERSLKRSVSNILNIFRRNKKKIFSESHIFKTRNFAAYYFKIPFMKFIDDETDRMLAFSSVQLNDQHILMHDYMASVLMTEREDLNSFQYHNDNLKKSIIDAGGKLISAGSWQGSLESFNESVMEAFYNWSQFIRNQFIERSCYTGTWILPHRRYGRVRAEKAQKKYNEKLICKMDLWRSHFEGETLDWSHEYAMNKRQISVIYDTLNTLDVISGKIETQLLPKCTDAIDLLLKTIKQLKDLKKDQDSEIRKSIVRESRVLVKTFRQELIPAIANRFLGAKIGHDINQILINVKGSIDNLADSHTVFKKRDDGVPPRSEMSKIPIKDLFREELLIKLQTVLVDFEQQLRIELDGIINTMSEVRNSVEFNIDTSFGLLEKEDYTEEALVMVTDGLQRSAGNLTEIKEKTEVIPERIKEELGKIAYQWVMNIHNLLDNEKIIAMKLTLAKARASSRFKTFFSLLKIRGAGIISRVALKLKKIYDLSIAIYKKICNYTGFTSAEDDIQIQFTQFLLDTRKTLDNLPFVYQQLFQIEPLKDSRLFYGRQTELESLTEEIKSWESENNHILTAIVGERGSGKTTLVNLLEAQVSKRFTVHICSFSETVRSKGEILSSFSVLSKEKPFDSMEELENFLMELKKPVLIVIENIHNFFIKSLDGFDQLEFFLGLMYRTRKKVLWICSCALYSWEYLDRSINISKAFNRVLMLKPFTEEQIEEMILARHRMTGYRLKFKPPPKKNFRKNLPVNEQQEQLKKEFFRQIQQIASGNISVAILFWLSSIKAILEHELQIVPQMDFNIKFLSQLNSEDLFTLGAIAQHELISHEDHSLIFRQDERRSFLTINSLFRMGILQQSGNYYRIHPFIYRHVIRYLKLQNILH